MSDSQGASTKEIGAAVREARLARKLSQNELARLARTTATSVSRIECGDQRPGRKLAPALARALDLDLNFLLAAAS